MIRPILTIAIVLLLLAGARAQSLHGVTDSLTSTAVAPACPSPTAPDGNVDLSQCSNAYYVAVILF